jgi:FkbM family methyltransferase
MGFCRTINMIKNLENWNSYLFYKFSRNKGDFFEFRFRNHFAVKVPARIQHEFKESVFEQIYFRKLPSALFHVENPIVIDIGANVGFFTLISDFKLRNPSIYSFEPIQRNFIMLRDNLEALDKSRIHIVNKAVSNHDKEIILTFDDKQDITTSASIFNKEETHGGEKVISTTLPLIIDEFRLSKIDLLKLDCEGAEYGIFYDSPKQLFDRVNCISLETHAGKEKNENTVALAAYLKDLGFDVKAEPFFIWAYRPVSQWRT